jgi:hypothetical protein
MKRTIVIKIHGEIALTISDGEFVGYSLPFIGQTFTHGTKHGTTAFGNIRLRLRHMTTSGDNLARMDSPVNYVPPPGFEPGTVSLNPAKRRKDE